MENSHTIKTKNLGTMSIIYVIVFYDYPRIFVCRNDEGLLFVFSESDTGADFCEWAVAKLTYSQLLDLNSGAADFSSIFLDNPLYLVVRMADKDICDSTEYTELPDDKLPTLHEKYAGFIDDYHRQLVQDISNKSMKAIVSFAINNRCEAYPSASYGQIKRLGDPVSRAASSIYPKYREDDISVVLSAASTVINFEFSDPSSWQGKLFPGDDLKPSEKIVTTLAKMNAATNSEDLFDASGRDGATVKAYKALIKSFLPIAKNDEISAIVALPSSQETSFVSFSKDKIAASLKNIDIVEQMPQPIDRTPFHLCGVLVGLLSKDTKTFQFCPEKTAASGLPDMIKGSADEAIFTDNPEFVLNTGRYEVDIIRTIDPSLRRKKTRYTLMSIRSIPALTSK
jgi:hypothetical protein